MTVVDGKFTKFQLEHIISQFGMLDTKFRHALTNFIIRMQHERILFSLVAFEQMIAGDVVVRLQDVSE